MPSNVQHCIVHWPNKNVPQSVYHTTTHLQNVVCSGIPFQYISAPNLWIRLHILSGTNLSFVLHPYLFLACNIEEKTSAIWFMHTTLLHNSLFSKNALPLKNLIYKRVDILSSIISVMAARSFLESITVQSKHSQTAVEIKSSTSYCHLWMRLLLHPLHYTPVPLLYCNSDFRINLQNLNWEF